MAFNDNFSPYVQRYDNGILICATWGDLFKIPDGMNQIESLMLTGKKYSGKDWNPEWLAEYGKWKSAQGFMRGAIMYRDVYDGTDLYIACKTYPEESVKFGDPFYLKVFKKGEMGSSIVPLVFDGADSSKFNTDRVPVMIHMMECGGSLIFIIEGCDRIWRLSKVKVKDFIDKKGTQ